MQTHYLKWHILAYSIWYNNQIFEIINNKEVMLRAIPEIIVWGDRKAVKLKFDTWWVFLMSSLMYWSYEWPYKNGCMVGTKIKSESPSKIGRVGRYDHYWYDSMCICIYFPFRFQAVRKHFISELKELKLRDQTPYTAQSIISLMTSIKYFKVKVRVKYLRSRSKETFQ